MTPTGAPEPDSSLVSTSQNAPVHPHPLIHSPYPDEEGGSKEPMKSIPAKARQRGVSESQIWLGSGSGIPTGETKQHRRLSRFPQRLSIPLVYNMIRPGKNFRTIG
jgi:hypothetical protein